jgi:hypothetical protein
LKFLTVFRFDDDDAVSVTADWLEKTLNRVNSSDDVFCNAFLQIVVFTSHLESIVVTPDARKILEDLGTTWMSSSSVSSGPASGPYAVTDCGIAPIRRLYDDTHGAFVHFLLEETVGYAQSDQKFRIAR